MAGGKWLWKLYPRTTWRMDLRQLALNTHLGWVNMLTYNFFVCVWTKVCQFFCVQRGGFIRSTAFPTFRYADLFRRYLHRSRELSKIAPNFGRFFTLPNFRRRAFQQGTKWDHGLQQQSMTAASAILDTMIPFTCPFVATLQLPVSAREAGLWQFL